MTTFKSLVLAIDLATSQRDQALTQLQAAQRALAFAQGQMNQLQQYAQETDQRWMTGAQVSTTAELMRHQYQFMGRLNQAIALQNGTIEGANRRVAGAQQALVQTELRLASLKQVLGQRQLAQARTQHRQEQKQMDEFAAQQTQRRLRQQAETES